MTRNELLRELEAELDLTAGSLHGTQLLNELENWDSMAAVQFIALADEKVGVTLSGHQIATSKTVDDLLALLGDRVAA